tara:strand:- start:524 stop:637 length:114 start_codon:yes stop_codon:yes gene_type:complete
MSSRKQYPEGSKNKPKEEEEEPKLVVNLDVSGNPTFN